MDRVGIRFFGRRTRRVAWTLSVCLAAAAVSPRLEAAGPAKPAAKPATQSAATTPGSVRKEPGLNLKSG